MDEGKGGNGKSCGYYVVGLEHSLVDIRTTLHKGNASTEMWNISSVSNNAMGL
jgi:hypothetical protein